MTNKNLGLNRWARKLVAGNPTIKYTSSVSREPDGAIEFYGFLAIRPTGTVARKVESGRWCLDAYGGRRYLHNYFFPPRKSWQPEVVLYEVEQFTPFHSGKAHCLALQDKHNQWIPESLWPAGTAGSLKRLPPIQFLRTTPLRI